MMTKPCLFMRKALYPRAFYSIALIAIGVFAAVVSGWLLAWLGFGSSGDSIGHSAGSAVVLADAIDSDGGILRLDPDKVLARFDQDAPNSFNAEVLDGWGDWHSLSDDGVIAGCVLPEDRITAIGEIGSLLEEKGWRAVPSGQEAVLTFVKEEGEFRWLMVSCESVGLGTSVVVNVRSANG